MLGTSLIVAAIGMSAVMVARLKLRQVTRGQDLREARLLADSAVEMGASIVLQDSNWRNNFNHASEYPATPLPLGKGTITWKLVDQDGDLTDDETDAVRLHGMGRVGQQTYTASVLLEPAGANLSCLEASLHVHGQFSMWDGVTVTTDQFVSTNDSIYTSGSGIISGDAQAVGTIASGSVTGTGTAGITPRQMPNADHALEYYLNNGTWIDINDIPTINGSRRIYRVVMSPGHNPFGFGVRNPEGIYVIDCQGQKLVIDSSRLEATLVLLNPGPGTQLFKYCHWAPAIRNFPALLCDGDFVFDWFGNLALAESTEGVNFNPAHSPYEGESDTDQNDTYPGILTGLIYVSGHLDIQHECNINGVVVAGTINPQADMNLNYDPILPANPAPGFRGVGVTSPEQQWLDQNSSNSGSGSNYTLGTGNGVGTYFAPSLPAEATSWSITRVQIYANDANSTGTFNAQVTKADVAQKPAAVVQSVLVQETDLPGTFDWHEIAFSSASGFQPTEGACVVFVSGPAAGSRIKCGTGSTGSPGTHRLVTTDSGGSWVTESSNDLWIKIWGTYTSASGSVVEISPGSWQREPGS